MSYLLSFSFLVRPVELRLLLRHCHHKKKRNDGPCCGPCLPPILPVSSWCTTIGPLVCLFVLSEPPNARRASRPTVRHGLHFFEYTHAAVVRGNEPFRIEPPRFFFFSFSPTTTPTHSYGSRRQQHWRAPSVATILFWYHHHKHQRGHPPKKRETEREREKER